MDSKNNEENKLKSCCIVIHHMEQLTVMHAIFSISCSIDVKAM